MIDGSVALGVGRRSLEPGREWLSTLDSRREGETYCPTRRLACRVNRPLAARRPFLAWLSALTPSRLGDVVRFSPRASALPEVGLSHEAAIVARSDLRLLAANPGSGCEGLGRVHRLGFRDTRRAGRGQPAPLARVEVPGQAGTGATRPGRSISRSRRRGTEWSANTPAREVGMPGE